MKSIRVAGLCSLLLVLSACHLFAKPKPFDLTGYRPASAAVTTAVVQALRLASSTVVSFKTLAHVHIVQDLGAERIKQTVVFRYPGDLRVDLYEPNINHRLGLVIVHDGMIQSLDLEKKEAFEGTANVQNLRQLLSVPLSHSEAMLWFVGRIEVPEDGATGAMALYESVDAAASFLFRYRSSDGRSIICKISGNNQGGELRIDSMEIRRTTNDELLFRTEYGYEATLNQQLTLPSVLRVEFPRDNTVVTISYERPKLNADLAGLPPLFFEFPELHGFAVIDLDQIADRSFE